MDPWAGGYDPHALLLSKVETLNNLRGDLKGYDCPLCKNRGYISRISQEETLVTVPCSCQYYRRCLQKMQRSGLQGDLKSYRLEGFSAEEDWQKAMLQGAKDYLADPGGWLLFSGQSGCGKTYLCICIARQLLLRGKQLLYMSWTEEIQTLKSFEDREQRDRKLEELKNAEYLYIDDLLKSPGTPSRGDLAAAIRLLGSRYNSRKPTILSTELLPEELMELDEALGGRILELSRTVVIKRDIRRNYRLKLAEKKDRPEVSPAAVL